MISAIYPGSFDPLHLGHEDIIIRASKLVDVLYVGVLVNYHKKHFLPLEKRLEVLEKRFEKYDNIKVVTFSGLLLDYCIEQNITFIIKGLRNTQDFQLEMDMAHGIKHVANEVETLFIPCSTKYSFISSSMVRDMHSTSGDVTKFISKEVKEIIGEV